MMSDYLCDELISKIFTRLPTKSLLRFRSLSKSWYSRISSLGFIRMHYSRSPQKLLIRHHRLRQIYESFYTLHSKDQLPLCPKRGYMDISQVEGPNSEPFYFVYSCNGILCLNKEDAISLWNPSIGRQLVVPDCPCPQICSSSWKLYGFGFDPIIDDYKIVCLSFPGEYAGPDSSFVYAVKTGTWCETVSPIPLFIDVHLNMYFFNGALHWLVERPYTESDNVDDIYIYILTFDLSTHVFGTIEVPQPSYKPGASRLTTIQGALGFIAKDGEGNIWIWEKRDASWSVILKLKNEQVIGRLVEVLQLNNNGDMLLLYEFMWCQVYNPKIGVVSRLVEFNAASYMVYLEMFVESLYLLDMESACESNHLSVLGGKKRVI